MKTTTKQQPFLMRAALTLVFALLTTATAWAQDAISGLTYNSEGGYYEIKDAGDLADLANYVNSGNNTSGKTFKLMNDITYTHKADNEAGAATENNYEAIGGYYNSDYRYFRGDFDGAGHTISGIRIYKDGDGYADHYQGIFGRTFGATIHGLRLADARITGYYYTGGIVGYNYGTVTDCHVANDVCIHAAKTNAFYHGGIAGYNYGTIESCTSAATLTIPSGATNCRYYGGIAGENYDTLTGNLAIGATVPAAAGNTHGAIAGDNDGTLKNNYYTACKVGSADVTPSGVGCENADVTDDDGAVPASSVFSQDGDTYTILNASGWDVFCLALQVNDTYNHFSGKTVKLGADITVTRMAGSADHEFQGTFDGNHKTLTVSISSSDGNAAPFREIMGATICNLKVSGTVSGHKHSAGLAGYARGESNSVENTIENCLVDVAVSTIVDTDGDCYLGGIVGHGFQCKLTIRGCAFTGSLTSPHNYTGGLQGWSDGNTLILEDDIFAASSVSAATDGFHPIAIHANNAPTTATVSNVYYTVAPTCTTATRIAAVGKAPHTVTAGENVTLALSGTATEYNVSGITAYEGNHGIKYGTTYYAGSGDQLALALTNTAAPNAPAGYQYGGYTVSAGELSGNATDGWTLTMPDEDVTISFDTDLSSTGNAVEVSYVDAIGTTKTAQAIALDGTENTLGSEEQESWYFVGTDISHSGQIDCEGDVHIILTDGTTMTTSGNSHGINGGDGSLTIYGQPLGTGTLNATGTEDVGIRGVGDISINGSTVNTNGIMSDGDVTINSGKVTSTGDPGILSNSGNIILGWTSPADRITADSYISYSGTVKVADGQGLTDGSGTSYSGTLTAGDINGKTLKPHWAGNGSSDSPYTISRTQELDLLAYRVNGTNGQTLQSDGYSGTYFRLGDDIAYTHKADNDKGAATESNYEAIGGYYGYNDRYFKGHFDGAGHTISGIRIYKGGNGKADRYQGIFGKTWGATIHSLRLADARITGYYYTGGIVGLNVDGTVTDCHVANDVCIHAVKTDASYHGGIAGGNWDTVENCTSAATLTIPSGATYCQYYGGIAGNNTSTLTGNLAIGATVPAAERDLYGAITGDNDGGTLEHNYYTACKVASTDITPSGVGCGFVEDGYDYISADVTDMTVDEVTYYDGAVPALRDQADNTQAIALLAALAQADDTHPVLPLDLGWGPGQFPLQLAGRTLYRDGAWNTLCLPFSVKLSGSVLDLDGVEVKTLETSTFQNGTLTMKFSEQNPATLTAGTPYIIRWTKPANYVAYDGTNANACSDLVSPVFPAVTVSSTDPATETTTSEYVDFVGTYQPTVIYQPGDEKTNLDLGTENTLYWPTASDFTVNAFRAYFRLKNNLTAGDPASASRTAVRAFALNFGDETTGINNVNVNDNENENGVWTTVGGVRLDGKPTQKGLYIHGGRKVVIK